MRTAILHNFLIEATIMSSIAIVLMMILRKTMRRQLGNSAICFGWLLVAARLLLPISFSNPLIHSIRSPFAADLAIRPISGQILVRTRDAVGQLSSTLWRTGNDVAANAVEDLYQGLYFGQTSMLLAKIYAVGLILVVGWFIFSNVRFRMKLRAGQIEPISGKLLAQYEAMCKERGVKPVPVIFTDPLPSACLVGVIRPYIALPLTASPADAIHVLTHEVCHLKNHDHLWSLLRLVCCTVHWFNPLVWIAADMSRTDTELRCDDRVVKPMNAEQRKNYANILVLAAARKNAPGVAVLATGMTMTGKKLKTRVLTVLKGKEPLRWLTVTFCVLASMCLVGAFATSELPEQIEHYEPWEYSSRFLTDDIVGNKTINSEAAAQAYASQVWLEVIGGSESSITATLVGDEYEVNATENTTGIQWYMRFSNSGVVVSCSTNEMFSTDQVYLDPEENASYSNEISQAADYMRMIAEQLAPGIYSRIKEERFDYIYKIGDKSYFHFTLIPKDEAVDVAWCIVSMTPDGTMQVIHFTTGGNG